MSEQLLATNTLGGYTVLPRLTAQIWEAVRPLFRFRQFVGHKENWGAHRGYQVVFPKYGRIPGTHGTQLETSTLSVGTITFAQSTCTIGEYGLKIPYTGKLEHISEYNLDDMLHKTIRDHQADTLDRAAAAQFQDSLAKYVCVDATTGTLTTNGVAAGTATSNLNVYHVKQAVDQLKKWKVPPYDSAGNYVCIGSVNALRGLKDDTTWIDVYRYTKEEQRLTAEAGKVYNCRFVEDVNVLSNALNTSYGEAVFFGDDAVAEVDSMLPQIRHYEEEGGRQKWIMWLAYLAFKIIWAGTGDSIDANKGWVPHIIHATSL
jgi:N4-gp56 family major capsid protein